jgi:AcrR family transcriptional regulator
MITKAENPDKADQIIEAAQKRFGLYGLEKTSMREIAEDLNLTKGSLYYYFPDKEHLYIAVIDKEQKEFIRSLEQTISTLNYAEEILMKYVEARIHYFRSLLNLSRLRVDAYTGLRPLFQDKWKYFNQQEILLISAILTKGMEQGQFFINNTEAMSHLYLDVLRGLRQTVLSRKVMMFIDEEEYDELVRKARSFTEIFIRGLKYSKK